MSCQFPKIIPQPINLSYRAILPVLPKTHQSVISSEVEISLSNPSLLILRTKIQK